jgi:hypothetical protein
VYGTDDCDVGSVGGQFTREEKNDDNSEDEGAGCGFMLVLYEVLEVVLPDIVLWEVSKLEVFPVRVPNESRFGNVS